MRENIFYTQKEFELINDIYSCNKITKTFIKISLKLKWLFSNISHRQKNKKLTLNSWLQTYQILTNDDEMFILCLSYLITTVLERFLQKLLFLEGYLKVRKLKGWKNYILANFFYLAKTNLWIEPEAQQALSSSKR